MGAVKAVESLLERLCVEFGFSLPPHEWDAIVANPPQGVEAFARRVWEAEGRDAPRAGDPLFLRLCKAVAEFPTTDCMRVVWPDGALIAEVDVDPKCRPLETTHVLGTFTPGPGFAGLAPALEDLRRKWAAGGHEAALDVSRQTDDLGITATDELGRRYHVFNLVFGDGGLLFAVSPVWSPSEVD